MKRTILFTAFILSILFSGMADAQEIDPCHDVVGIALGARAESSPRTIRRVLTNYNESRLGGGNYCLVFNISGGAVPVESDSQTFSLNVENLFQGHDNHDIYIFGLNLEVAPDVSVTLPILTITNNTSNRVIVSGLQMTNVKNGLKLQGTGPIEVRGSTITGAGGDPVTRTGACVDVLSDNARIISSAVSNCAEGIKIAASNVFLGAETPATYEMDKNTLIGNAIGIHQISGAGNKWPYNSISGGNGIVVDGGSRPVMRLAEGNLASLTCTQPEGATAATACEIQFDSLPEAAGEVEIYKTLLGSPVDSQGKDYIAKCGVGETSKCIFDATNASMLISQIMCGDERCHFTALQTDDDSSMYTESFKLKANISTILMPTGEIPIGGTAGAGGGGAGGGETGGGGPPEGEGLYIEGNDTGTLLVTEQPGGGGTGTVQQQAGSLPISVKACRFASTDNERTKGVFEMWWWLIFTLPLPYIMRHVRKNY